ncbi:MAG: class I SAM-dependent DNA methyltransferase [Promethearchaeota archaeon]
MKLYNEKAEVYHELYQGLFNYAEEFSIFNSILEKHTPLVTKLLELGCGSGSVTKYFMDKYECVGLDLSKDMVKIAKNTYPNGNFLQGDMRNLPETMDGQFDAVVSTGRSFTHLTTNKDCLECCKSVYRVLKPGGIFIFDNFSANFIFNNFKSKNFHEANNISRKSTGTPNLEHGFTWNWYAEYEVKDDDGELQETFSDYMELRAFTKDELDLLLTLAGFKNLQFINEDDSPLSLLSIGIKPKMDK